MGILPLMNKFGGAPYICSCLLLLGRSKYALNFFFHSTRKHHPDHFVVSHERPQRMLKGCRLIFLYKEMPNPCSAITRNQSQWKQPPSATGNKINRGENSSGSAN